MPIRSRITASMEHSNKQPHKETKGYADDLIILLSGSVENVQCGVMRSAFQFIEECDEQQLIVNPKKTELILSPT